MTRMKKTVSIFTAIILCVLTVCTAMCTLVCAPGGDVRTTRFFAVPFSYSLKSNPAPSLASSENKTVISWLRRKEPVFEDEDLDKLVKTCEALCFNLKSSPDKKNSISNLYNPQKNTSYYLRI